MEFCRVHPARVAGKALHAPPPAAAAWRDVGEVMHVSAAVGASRGEEEGAACGDACVGWEPEGEFQTERKIPHSRCLSRRGKVVRRVS